MSINNRKTLTKREFAEALGVSEAVVNKWLRLQKLQAVRLGRCVRIPTSELERVAAGGIR